MPSAWYRITWLGDSGTFHPMLGEFPNPGASKKWPLSRRDAETLRQSRVLKRVGPNEQQEMPAWRLDRIPTPRGREGSAPIPLGGRRGRKEPLPWLPPDSEAYLYLDVTLTLSQPGADPESRHISVGAVVVRADRSLRQQTRNAKREILPPLHRAFEAAGRDLIGNFIQRYQRDFTTWTKIQGVTLDFSEYHAMPQPGRPPKQFEAKLAELRRRHPNLSQAALARYLGVSRRTIARRLSRRAR